MHKRFGHLKKIQQITTWKDIQPVVIEEFGIIKKNPKIPIRFTQNLPLGKV